MHRIGALVPLTRPGWVEAGRQLLAGLELGIAEAGSPLELVVRDTAADPDRAAAAVDELADLEVAAVVGEYHSVVARAAAARADARGLPFLCSSAVLDALTDEPTDWVARLCPPQSRGWRIYGDYLLEEGHRRLAVVAQPSVYWASGAQILRDELESRDGTVIELDSLVPAEVCDQLAKHRATALLLLAGTPEPAIPIVEAVRRDPRLADLLLGAPAGQPEFPDWLAELGPAAAGIPFLRYLPDQLTPLGARVETALRERLGGPPSFVAFEGFDTITVLTQLLHTGSPTPTTLASAGSPQADPALARPTQGAPPDWSRVSAVGTRGRISFSRPPGSGVWQWAWPPVQVADRDPADPTRFRVLRSVPGTPPGSP